MIFNYKSIFAALLFAASATSAMAQSQMTLHLKSGETQSFSTNDIDSITFDNNEQAFDISIGQIENGSVTYTINPKSDKVTTYFQDILSKNKFDAESAKPENGGSIMGFDKAWFEWMASLYGTTWLDEMKLNLKEGEYTTTTDPGSIYLRWNTDYVVYCYGFNADGTATTDVETKVFKTPAPVPSTNEISAKIDKVTSNSFVATVTTTNDDPYFITAQSKENVDKFDNDDDLAYSLVSYNYDSPTFWQSGSLTTNEADFAYLQSDTDYVLIIFGFKDGPTTAIQKIPFHTPAE